jgi:sugar lactone lactonase YvrE
MSATSPQLKTLMTGLIVGESPRWHDGRLWFSNWGAKEIVALGVDGRSEVMARVPTTIPFSIDWLPDGRLLIVSGPEARLLYQKPDGSLATYADLSALAKTWNEIVVDARGNTYVNGSDYEFGPGKPFIPGVVALVRPDGSIRQVADDIHFPNGMVVTPDNKTLIVTESFKGRLTAFDIAADGTLANRRVWADLGQGGDGMCMDAEGAIWTPALNNGKPCCKRVREGGEVLEQIDLDLFCFACMLGGPDGKTLFMLVAEWRGVERMAELFQSHTGQVLVTDTPAPHAGRP